MQTYKRICVGCKKEFEAGSINGRYCKAPICRKMCKSGTRGIPEAVKQSVSVPEVVKPLISAPPKKIPEKKELGVVILRIKGKEYIPGLSDNPTVWVPVKKKVEKPVEEDPEDVVVKDKSDGKFDYEEHQGTNN